MQQINHYGLMLDPLPTAKGTLIYAELTPSSPLLVWRGFQPKTSDIELPNLPKLIITRNLIQRFWPFTTGRTWKQPHIRWWFEIHETEDKTKEFPESIGAHWYEYDGGAMTFRQAMWKAGEAVAKAVEEADGNK